MVTYAGYELWSPVRHDTQSMGTTNNSYIIGEFWQHQLKYSDQPSEVSMRLTMLQFTAAERKALRDFFDSKFGQVTPFWLRSYKRNFVVATAAINGATDVVVEESGQRAGLNGITRHVYIPELDICRKISSHTVGASTVTLTLDSGITGPLSAYARLENLYLVRFDVDTLEISSIETDGVSMSDISLIEVQRETP